MSLLAKSFMTRARRSPEVVEQALGAIRERFGDAAPKAVLIYLTVNHDQKGVIEQLRTALGEQTRIIGCSAQGVMGRGDVREDGYAASMMALGGESFSVAAECSLEVHIDSREKGIDVGHRLRASLDAPPKFAIAHFDPLCGVDIELFLDGVNQELDCPIIGGAAAHFFGTEMTTTYQYLDDRVHSKAAVVMAATGDFHQHMGISTGSSSVGMQMTVTEAQGNLLLQLDGRPALEVWREVTGALGPDDVLSTASLAIGVPVEGAKGGELIRAAFIIDPERRGVFLSASIPSGTRINLHHRTVEDVMRSAEELGTDLKNSAGSRPIAAVLGFECGARTKPFLGQEATKQENLMLQQNLAPAAEWAGPITWGEIFPIAGRSSLHNYTFPVLALSE